MDSSSSPSSSSVDTEPVSVAPSERHFVEYLADMYGAVLCLERLERAHNRDLVGGEEYRTTLDKTLRRIKDIEAQLNVAAASGLRYAGLDDFLSTYGVAQSSGAAQARLIAARKAEADAAARDADAAKKQQESQQQQDSAHVVNPTNVLQAAQHFITLMDCLKLNQRSTDQLYPLVLELINAVKRVHPDFDQLPRLTTWLSLLDSMKASDELSDEQMRELSFDVDRGYQAFYRYLDSTQSNKKNK